MRINKRADWRLPWDNIDLWIIDDVSTCRIISQLFPKKYLWYCHGDYTVPTNYNIGVRDFLGKMLNSCAAIYPTEYKMNKNQGWFKSNKFRVIQNALTDDCFVDGAKNKNE